MALSLNTIHLDSGFHHSPTEGLCLMEAVAYFAGEVHSDKPQCVSPVLNTYGITINDYLSDDHRQQLKPFIPRLIGTSDGLLHDLRRVTFMVDYAVRVVAPYALRVRDMAYKAEPLIALPPITDVDSAYAAREIVQASGAWDVLCIMNVADALTHLSGVMNTLYENDDIVEEELSFAARSVSFAVVHSCSAPLFLDVNAVNMAIEILDKAINIE